METVWLTRDDAQLECSDRLELARQTIADYVPYDTDQASTRDRILSFVDTHVDALDRSCVEGHLTASTMLLDAERKRVLLTHHRKLERWLQLGGHCDGDANLASVALREATEESGIDGLLVNPVPIDVDVHVIPARRDEPAHLHLDTRFLVIAPAGAVEAISDESLALGWFGPGDLGTIELDASVVRMFELVFR